MPHYCFLRPARPSSLAGRTPCKPVADEWAATSSSNSTPTTCHLSGPAHRRQELPLSPFRRPRQPARLREMPADGYDSRRGEPTRRGGPHPDRPRNINVSSDRLGGSMAVELGRCHRSGRRCAPGQWTDAPSPVVRPPGLEPQRRAGGASLTPGAPRAIFASPIFTRRLNNLTVSKKRMLASYPPFGPKVNTDGKWSLRYRLARSW